jgi:hypothetical protein
MTGYTTRTLDAGPGQPAGRCLRQALTSELGELLPPGLRGIDALRQQADLADQILERPESCALEIGGTTGWAIV